MPNDTRSPHEIEREIERERQELASTVDALQDKFSPETVFREVTRGFREHGGDIGTAISRSVKQNPVALTLTGIGLAWMMFGKSHEDRPDYDVMDRERMRRRSRALYDYDDDDDDDDYDAEDADRFVARRMRRRSVDAEFYGGSRDHYAGARARAGGVRSGYRTYPSWAIDDDWDDEEDDDDRGILERVGDVASSAAGSVKGGAQAAGSGAKSGAHSVASGVKGAAGTTSDAARGAASSVGDAASRASAKAARARRRLATGTENMTEAARERVIAARERAVEAHRDASAAARRNMRKGREAAGDFFEDQPLVAGALAMAVGAALAGALPRTRQEDEAIGAYRDELFDEAELIFRREKRKAERVARAALDEAENVAKEKRAEADASAPGDKSAAKAIADEAKTAAQRIEEAAKSEAEHQDLGNPKV